MRITQYAFVYFNIRYIQWHLTTTRSSQTARTSHFQTANIVLKYLSNCWVDIFMLALICIIVTIFPCDEHHHIIAVVKRNLTQIPLKLIFSPLQRK